MSTGTKSQSSSDMTRFAINLVRFHYESDENSFKEECRRIADYFDKNGDGQLASYVRVLIGDEKDVLVPMDE